MVNSYWKSFFFISTLSLVASAASSQNVVDSTRIEAVQSSLKPFQRPQKTEVSVMPAPTLNRIFFTAAERRALDEGRSVDTTEAENTNEARIKARPRTLNLDGYVVRNGKLDAVWINGSNTNTQKDNFLVEKTKGNQIVITTPQQQRKLALSPGQRGDLDKGEVIDRLPANALTRHKP